MTTVGPNAGDAGCIALNIGAVVALTREMLSHGGDGADSRSSMVCLKVLRCAAVRRPAGALYESVSQPPGLSGLIAVRS